MANLFKVGDVVICQKLGGHDGTKKISPEFHGVVTAVLSGGTKYNVMMKSAALGHTFKVHFGENPIVDEHFMKLA